MSGLFDDPPAAASVDDLVDEAIAEFQPYTREPIARERGQNMVRNLGDVLNMLADWKREDEPPPPPPAPLAVEPPEIPSAQARRRKPRKFPAETP